jgi:hypothetical protein
MDNHIGAIWYFIHDYNAHLERVGGSPLLADHYQISMPDLVSAVINLLLDRP